MMSGLSGKNLICFKKVDSVKEIPTSKHESFLGSILDLNQICKKCFSKTIKFGSLTQLTSFILSRKIVEMLLIIYKMSKN